jgi:hypothetical protein
MPLCPNVYIHKGHQSIPMSEYVKTCTYCKSEIQMSDKEGRWLPFNKDGSTHDCKKKNGKQEFTLEAVQKKLESLGIIVNVERLMAQ